MKRLCRSVSTLVVGAILFLAGCSVARDEVTGDVVAGFQIGSLPETAKQYALAASNFLPPPFNMVAAGAATLLLGGGGAAVAKRNADKARQRERDEWDEAQRATELANHREGAAFDEGAQRAAGLAPAVAQQPVVVAGTGSSVPLTPVDDRPIVPQT